MDDVVWKMEIDVGERMRRRHEGATGTKKWSERGLVAAAVLRSSGTSDIQEKDWELRHVSRGGADFVWSRNFYFGPNHQQEARLPLMSQPFWVRDTLRPSPVPSLNYVYSLHGTARDPHTIDVSCFTFVTSVQLNRGSQAPLLECTRARPKRD